MPHRPFSRHGLPGELAVDMGLKEGTLHCTFKCPDQKVFDFMQPIKSDPALVQILSKLDIDEQIPVELYKAVAEILAFVYSANNRYRDAPVQK